MTNPLWVVKVRMFTSSPDSPRAYRGLWRERIVGIYHFLANFAIDGLSTVWRTEGLAGLWKGTILALVGVSNGAVQFMVYEEMKRWGFDRKRKQFAKTGRTMTLEDEKLVMLRCPSISSSTDEPFSSRTRHILSCQAQASCLLLQQRILIRLSGPGYK